MLALFYWHKIKKKFDKYKYNFLKFGLSLTLNIDLCYNIFIKGGFMERVIFITGASDGLGKALAEHYSKTDKVVAVARNEEKLKELAILCGCDYFVCDVTNFKQVESVIDDVISRYGKIDVLINSAGVLIDGELSKLSFDEIQNAINVNLTGLINATKSVSKFMKKQKQGTILNINSQGGISSGMAEKSIYNASKYGVTGFSRCIQPELAKYGIRVTDIFSGRMQTSIFEKVGLKRDMSKAVRMKDMINLTDFVLNTPNDIVIPEIGIKHIDG